MVDMPDPPDPYATAQAQAKFNKETAVAQTGLNAMNQDTPEGTMEYSENGTWSDGTPKFSVKQTYSPTNQAIFDLGQQTKTNLGQIGVDQSAKIKGILSNPLSLNVGGMPSAPDASRFAMQGGLNARYAPDPTMVGRQDIASNADIEKKLFDAGMSRLRPQLDQRRAALDASLADKGIAVGSDAYSRSMTENAQNENDAMTALYLQGQGQAFDQARARATDTFGQDLARTGQYFTQGAQKAAQDFGQDLSARTQSAAENDAAWARAQQAYANAMQGRQQSIDEILLGRNQPLNEIIGLTSGSQIQKPNWTSTPQSNIQPVDYTGLVNQQYQAQMQASQGALSGIGSIFGSLMKLPFAFPSDRRLKRNIERVGEYANGLGRYLYRYVWSGEWFIGVMSDEVRKLKPHAVTRGADGYDRVNYDLALGAA